MAPASKEKEKEKDQRPRKKPGRVPTSCAECRRLKLKCDKGVPCQKCVSRGCGSICPDGSLVSGKGNRFFLANTEELHDEIDRQKARIRELEQSLQDLQGTVSANPQPMQNDSTYPTPMSANASSSSNGHSPSGPMEGIHIPTIIRPPQEQENLLDAFGTLTLDGNGAARFLGNTARPEYLARVQTKGRPMQTDNIFPLLFGKMTYGSCLLEGDAKLNADAGREIIRLLPTLSEAVRLAELYLSYGEWLFPAMSRTDLFDDAIQDVFRADQAQVPETWYHKLAVVFSVFAIGALFDNTVEPFSTKANDYFHAARTALSFLPPYRSTTLASIQALLHLVEYIELSDKDAVGPPEAWIYDGLALRLCQAIGLHLDSSRWKLDYGLTKKRNELFWAVFTHDTWLSFWYGRPPMLDERFIDCPLMEETVTRADGTTEMNYRTWTWRYTQLLHDVLTTAFNARTPPYTAIIELDRRVRDFPVPEHLRPICTEGTSCMPDDIAALPSGDLRRWFVLMQKESTLLNLHRAYFAVALDEKPTELSSHRYVPSVLATYRSAWRLGKSLQLVWGKFPESIARVGLMWSQGLSAAIVMCLLVTRAPTAKMAPSAYDEIVLLADMFEKASQTSPAAANLLEAVRGLKERALAVINNVDAHDQDVSVSRAELDRMGGKTGFVRVRGGEEVNLQQSSAASTHGANPTPYPGEPSSAVPPFLDRPSGVYAEHFQSHQPVQQSMEQQFHPTMAEDLRNFEAAFAYDAALLMGHDEPNRGGMSTSGGLGSGGGNGGRAMSNGVNGLANGNGMNGAHNTHGSAGGSADGAFFPGADGAFDGLQPAVFGGGVPVLDATWQSFVEQLGF